MGRKLTLEVDISEIESWIQERIRNNYSRREHIDSLLNTEIRNIIKAAAGHLAKDFEAAVYAINQERVDQEVKNFLTQQVKHTFDWSVGSQVREMLRSTVETAVKVQYSRAIEQLLGLVEPKKDEVVAPVPLTEPEQLVGRALTGYYEAAQ